MAVAVKIKCEDVVVALKQIGLTVTANAIAQRLGTDSRAVATAVRAAVNDGRVKITFPKRGGGPAYYRFVRITPVKKDQ